MHVDFDPLKVDWSHFAGPINRLDAMVLGMSGGGGGGGGNTASSASYPVFTGLPYQRGAGGLGSMFRSFLRVLLPIGRQAGAAIGRQGLETGSRVLSQVLEGRDLKDSLVSESKAGLKNLLEKAAENVGRQKGSGGSGGTFYFKRYRRHLGGGDENKAKQKTTAPKCIKGCHPSKQHLQSAIGPAPISADQPYRKKGERNACDLTHWVPIDQRAYKPTTTRPPPLGTMSCPKKISEQSELAFNSALNVFAVPPTNVSVNRSFFRELLPLSTISQEGPYLFRMFNDSLWSDMSRVYLFLELGIVKEDGGQRVPIDAQADPHVAPIQCIGQTFVEVQNTELYDSGTLYPYKAYMTNELSFPASVKGHFMASSGYYPSFKHDVATDAGFIARCRRFAGGRKARFISRLDFDLGNQELYLLNNMDVLFTIYRAKDDFLLHCLAPGQNKGAKYSLYLHDIKLYVKMVEVQPSLNMSIYKTLERQPATYAVRKTEMKSVYLSAGRTEMEYNIFSAAIPRRVTIALVLNRAFNGDLAHSPFNFRPYSIRDISVHAAGQTYPAVPHRMNFADAAYVRPFVDMYEALGMANSERSMDITLDQFQDGWTFFVVPLTSTLDDSCGFELLRSGTTSIRLQFNNDIPTGGVEMLVLGEFDQLIMIDYNRHIVWMIVYEPGDNTMMLFGGEEIRDRVIASAPFVSPINLSQTTTSSLEQQQQSGMFAVGAAANPFGTADQGTTGAVSTDASAHGADVNHMHILQALLLFANYAIVLPMFLLCWMAIVRWLRHSGYISERNGNTIVDEHRQSTMREANRMSSYMSGAIPEPMRTAVHASIAIPMMVSAESSMKRTAGHVADREPPKTQRATPHPDAGGDDDDNVSA
uniref:Uncharacterized protein n=1 Tax=Globodera rostochiensis TaxID=31243 RepID=A0A914H8Q2_GLORO